HRWDYPDRKQVVEYNYEQQYPPISQQLKLIHWKIKEDLELVYNNQEEVDNENAEFYEINNNDESNFDTDVNLEDYELLYQQENDNLIQIQNYTLPHIEKLIIYPSIIPSKVHKPIEIWSYRINYRTLITIQPFGN